MPETPVKILVEVSGGVVTQVSADREGVEVTIVDHDDDDEDGHELEKQNAAEPAVDQWPYTVTYT